MICWSDNDAWEDLETLIGHGDYNAGLNAVTSFAKAHGFEDTGRLIGGESIYSFEADNTTSVSDTGELLSQVYHKEFVSEAASEKLLELMKEQHIITKIPAGLPEGIESANKTGELSGIENDAAIVLAPEGMGKGYVLTVLSNDLAGRNEEAIQAIVQISAQAAAWYTEQHS
jgi:beta-lactamase class A